MADEMQQQQQLADALKQLLVTKLGPEAAAEYTDDEIAKLLAAGYKGARQLRLASRESLWAVGVKPALVDELVHAFAAPAAAAAAAPAAAAAAGQETTEPLLLRAIESVVEKTVLKTVGNLEETLGSAVAQLGFWSHMQLQDFRSDSTPSVQRAAFKKLLVTHYQPECNTEAEASKPPSLTCMVTGVTANWGDVQAGHIIGMKHRQYASAMEINVMSERNGILWLSVLEDAWTKRQFCFTCPPGDQGVRFTLLDKELEETRLVDHPGAHQLKHDTQRALRDLTFGQLNGTPLIEPVTADKRPYRRALCFMAHVYRKLAEADHWPVPSDALDDKVYDYWSEFDSRSKVEDWLAAI